MLTRFELYTTQNQSYSEMLEPRSSARAIHYEFHYSAWWEAPPRFASNKTMEAAV